MSANQLDHEFSFTYSVRCPCEDCVKTMASMRALRLWHWKRVIENRSEASNRVKLILGDLNNDANKHHLHKMQMMNAIANNHMKFVQTLNDFFPEGDTAEKDAAK